MEFKLLDTVILTENVPEEGLTTGMKGAIVHIFNEPSLAYEVEFTDSEGKTIAEVALRPDQLKLFHSSKAEAPSAVKR